MHVAFPLRPIARVVLLITTLLGLGAGLAAVATSPASAAEGLELQFLQLTNDARANQGLAPLQMSEPINSVAEAWSGQMAANGALSHRSDLVSQIQPIAPSWTRLGENVGVGGSLGAIQSAFMASSGHAANILGDYNYVGIGVVSSGGSLWVTVNFVKHPTPLPGPSVAADSVTAVRPDGVLTTSPDLATVRGGSRLDTAVLGNDGQVYWTGSAGGGFSGWRSLGKPAPGVQGAPAMVSWSPGRLDVFVRGGDNRLWQRFSTDSGGSWSGWFQPVGASGVLASSPEASSWAPGRLDIFVLGTDGRIYQLFFQGGWSGWVNHSAPPPGAIGAPTATSWSPGRVDVFVRGNDNRLWQRFWDGSRWSAWTRPPGDTGTLASSPSATSSAPGRLSVATRGADDGVYVLTFAGGWQGWRRVGTASHVVTDAPSATSRGFGELQIAARGADAREYLFSTTG